VETLQTDRLVIRPFTLDDLEAAYELYDLDLAWGGPGVTLEDRRERLRFQIGLPEWAVTDGLYGDRAIVLKETGELIGFCGFRPWLCKPEECALFDSAAVEHPFSAPELGVGYALSTRYRGQGYAAEAVRALIDYAFRKLRVRRVVALTERGNADSVRLMQRVGMTVGFNPDPEAVYPWAVGVIENKEEVP
jgi:ribosomal-protein-alanine N-acetyltransferase